MSTVAAGNRLRVIVTVALCAVGLMAQDALATRVSAARGSRFGVGVTQRTFVRPSASWGARTLDATIWYPAAHAAAAAVVDNASPAPGRFHLIVYSHGGCGGRPQAIAPLAAKVVGEGFVFVQFPHPGSTTDDCAANGERYTRALLERPDDIVYLLDQLARLDRDPAWSLRGHIDVSRIGIIGHSQGGQTALMMPAIDARVRATLSISPSVAHPDVPPAEWQAIARARVPVMIMHGADDSEWTSEGPRKAYDSLPAKTPRAYLEIAGMGHTPRAQDQVALVVGYAVALFRRYLDDDRRVNPMLRASAAPPNVNFTSSRFP